MATLKPLIGRLTDNPDALIPFYCDGLGFELRYRFHNGDRLDGIMLAREEAHYHLEFMRIHGGVAGRAPPGESPGVLHINGLEPWRAVVARMRAAGFPPLPSYKPFWDRCGRTFEDPDGYMVVLQQGGALRPEDRL